MRFRAVQGVSGGFNGCLSKVSEAFSGVSGGSGGLQDVSWSFQGFFWEFQRVPCYSEQEISFQFIIHSCLLSSLLIVRYFKF